MDHKCLPRCIEPVFPSPCPSPDTGDRICCLKWTMPCGESGGVVTLSVDAILLGDFTFVNPAACPFNLLGNFGLYIIGGQFTYINDDITCLNASAYQDSRTGRGHDMMEYHDQGCWGWPSILLELYGIDPETTGYPYKNEEDFEINCGDCNFILILPAIRWYCVGYGQIEIEVGWVVRSHGGAFPIPPQCDIHSEHPVYWFPISRGVVKKDWHLGEPFELDSIGTSDETEFRSLVTPVICNYEPCGDPLDCFPDCISGTDKCDGMTPAHAPVMLTISAAEDCCLTGTFPLIYNESSESYAIPPDARPYCTIHSDATGTDIEFTLSATLGCNTGGGCSWNSPSGGGGFVCLTIVMTDGNGDSITFGAGVYLTCSGGSLTPATGTFSIDTFCGDNSTNDFDWTIS